MKRTGFKAKTPSELFDQARRKSAKRFEKVAMALVEGGMDGMKREIVKQTKRGTLKKKSKQPISKIQRKLWNLCKEITRKKHGPTCYTCGSTGLIGSNWHTGHLWPKASLGAYLKYDLRVLRSQCYNCNINRGGMGADYYKKMLKEIGPEKMAELEADRQKSVKAYDHYVKLISDYQNLLSQMK